MRRLTKREQKIANLSAELQRVAHEETPFLPAWADKLTLAEERFLRRAIEKNAGNVHRGGWPDFLVEETGGGLYCVEVKTDTDEVRPNQRAMFAALDGNGIRVYIWNPSNPGSLVPWRKYFERQGKDPDTGLRVSDRRSEREPSRRPRDHATQHDPGVNRP